MRYAEQDPTIFDSPASNPRAWRYISDLLQASEKHGHPLSALRTAVMGAVDNRRAAAFMALLGNQDRPLLAADILQSYPSHRHTARGWIAKGRIDLAQATMLDVLKHLQPQGSYQRARKSRTQWGNLGQFLGDLPGDLQEEAQTFFSEREYDWPGRAAGKRRTTR